MTAHRSQRQALLVGFRNVIGHWKDRLAKEGVQVVGSVTPDDGLRAIPIAADLVIVFSDHATGVQQNHFRAEAHRRGVDLFVVQSKWSQARAHLERGGALGGKAIVDLPPPPPPVHSSPEPSMAVPVPLPPNLPRIAQDETSSPGDHLRRALAALKRAMDSNPQVKSVLVTRDDAGAPKALVEREIVEIKTIQEEVEL